MAQTIQISKLYRSGEITHFSGISRQTLYLYSQAGLIQETKRTSSGQKLYDESIFEILSKIKDLQALKLTLAEIKKVLKEDKQYKFDFLENTFGPDNKD
jgi:DNA-binding transcriptional MerR regulator